MIALVLLFVGCLSTIFAQTVTNPGGRVIAKPNVCVVFWGNSVAPNTKNRVNELFVDVVESTQYLEGLSEYGVLRKPRLHPSCGQGVTINPARTVTENGCGAFSCVTKADLEAELRDKITAKTLPAADADTVFLVFFPPADQAASFVGDCDAGCGAHSYSAGLTYAVIPDFQSPACTRQCTSKLTVNNGQAFPWLNYLEVGTTVQLINTITNPGGDGWSTVDGKGVATVCDGKQDTIEGHSLSQWWSQEAGECVTKHTDYIRQAVACGTYDLEADGTLKAKQWTHHPYDCTDQYDKSVCMYCKGRANDKIVETCLPRLGSTCNGAFRSPPRSTFCNLEFECPATSISFSILVLFATCVVYVFFA